MGKIRPTEYRRQRRLKPSLQQWLYHARQPLLMLSAGTVIALAINFAVGQIHLSPSSDNELPSLSNTTNQETSNTLGGFDIKTDPENKEVRLILHRETSAGRSNKTLDVHPAKKGNQYTLTIENTQLSQQMVDNGLPVVIDNHNKLIGRAVPGKSVNQTKIIIPNLPSQEDYQILVYEQTPGNQPKLISGNTQERPSDFNQVTQNTSEVVTVPQTLSSPYQASLPTSVRNIKPETPLRTTPKRTSPQLSTMSGTSSTDTMKPRLKKAVVASKKPQPRSAVSQLESQFDTIANNSATVSTAITSNTPSALTRAPLESYALSSVAKADNTKAAKKPIQIVENTSVETKSFDETASIPNLRPLNTTANITTNTQGNITYVPAFSSKRTTRSNFAHGPLWNPYVVKDVKEDVSSTDSAQGSTITLSSVPPLQSTSIPENRSSNVPSPDPLWYLHNLSAPSATSDVPLQPLPDLSQGVPTSTSSLGLTTPAVQTAPTTTEAISQNKQLIQSIKQVFKAIPIWFYVVFGLFFGGIGLFSLFASLYLLQQFWLNISKRPITTKIEPALTEEKVEVVVTEPIQEEPESIQFKDSANIQMRQYLEQGRARDQQQAIKQAVKQSVLLQFPSHRVSSRTKSSRNVSPVNSR